MGTCSRGTPPTQVARVVTGPTHVIGTESSELNIVHKAVESRRVEFESEAEQVMVEVRRVVKVVGHSKKEKGISMVDCSCRKANVGEGSSREVKVGVSTDEFSSRKANEDMDISACSSREAQEVLDKEAKSSRKAQSVVKKFVRKENKSVVERGGEESCQVGPGISH